MILEGLVTTLGPGDVPNVAPMGPRLFAPYALAVGSVFELRPFHTSHTAANLRRHPEGVLHVTDDVLLLARAAIGDVPLPESFPAQVVCGVVLAGACRAYEFRTTTLDDQAERWTLRAEVCAVHRLRDFFGLNRALHAVVEAAILATRTMLLPAERVWPEIERLAVLIDKTGGEREREAFALLRGHIQAAYSVPPRSEAAP